MSKHISVPSRPGGARRGSPRKLISRIAVPLAILAGVGSFPNEPVGAATSVRRINAGAGSVTDSAGRVWSGDAYYSGTGSGIQHATGLDITGTSDDAVFQTNRWGMTGYNIPVPKTGKYRVRLLFAETVFQSAGARVFDVSAEGRLVLDDLDVYGRVGHGAAYTHSFVVSTKDRTINLRFGRVTDDPMISGIEVIDERSGSTATRPVSSTTTTAPATTTTAPPTTPTTTAPTPTTTAPTPTTTAPPQTTTTTVAPAPAPTTTTTAPPAPTTTTTTPPPPAPSGTFPGPGNTGVPAGTVLRPSGGFTVTTPGAVVENLDVTGCILVRANNVTIRNTRVRGSCWAGAIDTDYGAYSGILIHDVEIDGRNENAGAALLGNSGFTCRRCNIHHGGGGVRMTSDVVLEDSWIHDIYGAGDTHNSGVGSNGGRNFVVRNNNIDCSTLPNCSGALVLYGDFNPVQDVLVENNLFNGGGFCVYGGSVPGKPYPVASNTRFLNNAFGRSAFQDCGYYGPYTSWSNANGNVWSGNHWVDTKAAV